MGPGKGPLWRRCEPGSATYESCCSCSGALYSCDSCIARAGAGTDDALPKGWDGCVTGCGLGAAASNAVSSLLAEQPIASSVVCLFSFDAKSRCIVDGHRRNLIKKGRSHKFQHQGSGLGTTFMHEFFSVAHSACPAFRPLGLEYQEQNPRPWK